MAEENGKKRAIPNRVDEPVPFLLWEPIEFIVAITSLGFFLAVNMVLVGIILMVGILWISRELKKGSKRGAAQHAMWAIGVDLDPVLPVRFPPAWVTEFIE